ncbi:GntR family transcriptional regulator [Nocardia farcinica]|uniref:DNA-binding transcriptional repressor MngR n=1 Tax=Nocardia farcinica TaxID=37329 RepID=A0A0H5NY47_NOCFR|nr:GntR family transcriptional regulator [Nocardia farcinica]AXK86647.1 GntR family transcriptional regulator [Nocardia farcinica]PFW99462.1 Mannosyl-D-glycerate transport/metabolism system repressor MngR [Nocardia farcinica]PFX00720.1 Mannosyl-D-glycerate transport/metabolism system repressor MngR [Nocardia farcinica]CRY79964.1 DNA-binding transcriptional repressor MngR [Nocardia farcinica]SIT27511.1 GntR family transcriptional regulator [Nocardia farcinica]
MVAKYERVAESIRHKIRTKQLPAGERLPAETALSEEYKVSVPTIRQAMGVLRAEGLIESRQGIGTYVRAPRQKVRRDSARHQWEKDRARSAETERRATGATERDTGLAIDDLQFTAWYDRVEADERLAAVFEIPVGTTLLQRNYRTKLRNEPAPLNLSTSYMVYDVAAANPELVDDTNEPWPGGTHHQLYTLGIEVDRVVETVSTRPPTTAEVEELDITPTVSVFVVRKRMIDTSGHTVEYSDVILPGDRTEMTFETKLTRWDRR